MSYNCSIVEQNPSSSIIWTGDINADFSRFSDHTQAVRDALVDLGLHVAWDKYEADFSCSHEILGQSFTSLLDHFFWSTKFSASVTDAGVLHLPGNLSDHETVFCSFTSSLIEEVTCRPCTAKPRPSWGRASTEQKNIYTTSLEQRLAELIIPVSVTQCNDLHCQDPRHREDLDQYTMAVLESIQDAAEVSLPIPGVKSERKKQVIPGWKTEVKPFRDSAFFWHQIWKSCGCPINSEIHRMMKHTRNTYHYQFRKCKRAEEKIKRDKFLAACLGEGGNGNIFKEIKALRKSGTEVATSIDGVSQDIPDHFGSVPGQP